MSDTMDSNKSNNIRFASAPESSKNRSPSPSSSSRKVSFSDQMPHPPNDDKSDQISNSVIASPIHFDLTIVDHRLKCQPIEPDDDLVSDTALALVNKDETIQLVRLGMLKQATIYRADFVWPNLVDGEKIVLRRFNGDGLPQPSANVSLVECRPNQPPSEDISLVLEIATTHAHRLFEAFALESPGKPVQYLILKGLALGRNQGTPCLHAGLRRIGRNPDYDDSDDQTDWPGFDNDDTQNEEEEEDDDEEFF